MSRYGSHRYSRQNTPMSELNKEVLIETYQLRCRVDEHKAHDGIGRPGTKVTLRAKSYLMSDRMDGRTAEVIKTGRKELRVYIEGIGERNVKAVDIAAILNDDEAALVKEGQAIPQPPVLTKEERESGVLSMAAFLCGGVWRRLLAHFAPHDKALAKKWQKDSYYKDKSNGPLLRLELLDHTEEELVMNGITGEICSCQKAMKELKAESVRGRHMSGDVRNLGSGLSELETEIISRHSIRESIKSNRQTDNNRIYKNKKQDPWDKDLWGKRVANYLFASNRHEVLSFLLSIKRAFAPGSGRGDYGYKNRKASCCESGSYNMAKAHWRTKTHLELYIRQDPAKALEEYIEKRAGYNGLNRAETFTAFAKMFVETFKHEFKKWKDGE